MCIDWLFIEKKLLSYNQIIQTLKKFKYSIIDIKTIKATIFLFDKNIKLYY